MPSAAACAAVLLALAAGRAAASWPKPGVAALPSVLQAAQRSGWPSARAAHPLVGRGPRQWGAPCGTGGDCTSGLCCSSCSAAAGSCVCPCEDAGEASHRNGPWNGQWPVARCCCGTLAAGDEHINEEPWAVVARGAVCNSDDRRPAYSAAVAKETAAAAPARTFGLKGFGERCHHYSECGSGICATGCDCDNSRLDIPQPCSCNCVTPSDRGFTCGGFAVGVDPILKSCPPCDAATCAAHASTPSATCQYVCLEGAYHGMCHDYPPFFLGTPRCTACCNLNMCTLVGTEANLRRVFAASGGYVPGTAAALTDFTAFAAAYTARFAGHPVAGDLLFPSGVDDDHEDIWTRDLRDTNDAP
eukprot:TRINITY_DN1609_c0_g1_i1.p1 TRINITY_DN1609_c0_g1~~TRINITY_DN1609_c0_g1_i1.p1  ORF type:complete len:359 (+),score=33.16 TRINITY_DN1609_c0_g1_i1:85-1161(+)